MCYFATDKVRLPSAPPYLWLVSNHLFKLEYEALRPDKIAVDGVAECDILEASRRVGIVRKEVDDATLYQQLAREQMCVCVKVHRGTNVAEQCTISCSSLDYHSSRL